MNMRLVVASVVTALMAALPVSSVTAGQRASALAPRDSRVPAGGASLYAREIGRGQSILVLHGGPDFDHAYLLPDLDRLANRYRLIYYDQRGRGRSVGAHRARHPRRATGDVERVRPLRLPRVRRRRAKNIRQFFSAPPGRSAATIAGSRLAPPRLNLRGGLRQ
jgi:hypothetical protein